MRMETFLLTVTDEVQSVIRGEVENSSSVTRALSLKAEVS